MSEPSLSITADDDLPRTLRREREARERVARGIIAPAPLNGTDTIHASAPAATVTDIDVPFAKLAAFFLKAVLAALPALVLLTVMLWLFGQTLQHFFPQLLKLKILIYMPQ